jgi:hypothetical protein
MPSVVFSEGVYHIVYDQAQALSRRKRPDEHVRQAAPRRLVFALALAQQISLLDQFIAFCKLTALMQQFAVAIVGP